ncbi:choline transporter-like protein 1 isoform X3 [Tachypleus tridentatus]|uniref:choline transporter-like protein 1 isoform X3 n=1 Tax=Tachypleus tridentatus TaxID=6853 RepID=UPI003FD4F237
MGCFGAATRVHSSSVNGRPVPPDLENFDGPVKERQCRDVTFLILFAFFFGFWVYILGRAGVQGNPDRLFYGYDLWGNLCGRENENIAGVELSGRDMRDKPFLRMTVGKNVTKECVASCLKDDYQLTFLRRCFPSFHTASVISEKANISNSFLEEAGSDIALCWREIIYMCLIAFGLACIVLVLLRFLAGFIIWFVIISFSLASICVTIYAWCMWKEYKNEVEKLASDDSSRSVKETKVKHWLAGAIVMTIFTVIFLLIVIFMRNRIKLVAALFKEAGKAIISMPLILLQPIWVMKWYHLLAFFWLTQFIIACQHVVIAGSVASWFFTRDKSQLDSPIWTSFYRLVRYHLGSIALGSLLIALLKLVRAFFKGLKRHMRNHPDYCKYLLKCCQCCLWCFERFLVFINRNALIEVAIYGYSFCKAAQQAFHLLSSNVLRVAAINSLGDFILLLGKVGVAVATAFAGLEIIKNKEDLQHNWVPVTVGCIFAFLISHCFLGVYEMAIDTLFLCFCEDCERNDGVEKPYYMSSGLMVFVENSKKALEAEENRKNEGG